jgi:hypothetical protein
MRNIGIVLMVIGLIMVLFTGFQYFTKEKVVDVGPVEVYKDKAHNVNWSPIIGGILIVGGIALFAADKKK